jgi:tetratricopeptide (TPR) repeat protein
VVAGERYWLTARRAEAWVHFEAAETIVADAPASPAKAAALSQLARFRALGDEYERSMALATEALEMAEQLHLPTVAAHALNSRGISRVGIGDFEQGLADLERSVELTRGRDVPELDRALGNLASVLTGLGDIERSRALTGEALQLAVEHGFGDPVRWLTGELANLDYLQGDWDAAAPTMSELAESYLAVPFWMQPIVFAWNGRLLAAHGRSDEARPWLERAVERAREARDLQMLCPTLAIVARVHEELGDDAALALAREVVAEMRGNPGGALPDDWLKDLWFVLDRHGEVQELETLLGRLVQTRWVEVVRACAAGDFSSAVSVYAELGVRTGEADLHMWAADRLAQEGRAAEADAEARLALAFWQSVGAVAHVRRTEALLAAAS